MVRPTDKSLECPVSLELLSEDLISSAQPVTLYSFKGPQDLPGPSLVKLVGAMHRQIEEQGHSPAGPAASGLRDGHPSVFQDKHIAVILNA